jgi:hypothetical protein
LIQLYRRGRNGTELSGVFQKLVDVLLSFGGGPAQMTFYVIFEKMPKTGGKLLHRPVWGVLVEESEQGIHFIAEWPVRVYVVVKIHRLGSYFS